MSNMRILLSVLLAGSAAALSGCVSNTLDHLTNLNTSCAADVISVGCSSPTSSGQNSTTTTTTGTTTTTAPTQNTGNTNTFSTGDTTIILEGSTVKSLVGNKPGVSQLADSPLNHTLAKANASGTYDPSVMTANQSIAFNTNTSSNNSWPVPKTMFYNEYGTCSYSGGVDPNPANAGKCVNGNGGSGLGDDTLGGDYKLYRAYQKGSYDEELQIWTWNNSYATQYRDVTASGTDPQHQAWSFGGNYTPAASMPTANANVNYTGKFGATAKTSNFVDTTNPGQTMSFNNNWRVEGSSALTANFGTGAFSGTLTPEQWEGMDRAGIPESVQVSNTADPNYDPYFMKTKVLLAGTITKDATPNSAKPNQITGTATLDPSVGWLTSTNTNPMYGGVFGANGKEITGAFAVDGATTQPNDGYYPINNDLRGYLQMSGIFHGEAP